jgi:hypothetical protein
MKLTIVYLVLTIPLIFSDCKKLSNSGDGNLQGTWNFSGYSGGFAGRPFIPVSSEGPYIQIQDSQLLITDGAGYAEKCMHFMLTIDSTGNSSVIIGILTLSDTSFMLPMPDRLQYTFSLKNNLLSLTPLECDDCYTYSYKLIPASFMWCN